MHSSAPAAEAQHPGPRHQQQRQEREGLQPADFGAVLRAAAAAAAASAGPSNGNGGGSMGSLDGPGAAALGNISALDVGPNGGTSGVGVEAGAASIAVGCTDGWVWLFESPGPGAAAGEAAAAGLEARLAACRAVWAARVPQGAAMVQVSLCPSSAALLASAHEDGTVAVHGVRQHPAILSPSGQPAGAAAPCCAALGCHVTALGWQPGKGARLACGLADSSVVVSLDVRQKL